MACSIYRPTTSGCGSKGTTQAFFSLADLLQDFKRIHRGKDQLLKDAYAALNDEEAIYHAAHLHVLNKKGTAWKRHPHFHRPWFYKKDYVTALATAAQILKKNRSALRSALDSGDFDLLHQTVKRLLGGVKWLKELAYYDMAELLGFHRNLAPTTVYLHAGTRKGALELFGADRCLSDHLSPATLKKRFEDLKPGEIEDFLCLYSKELKLLRSQRRLPSWSYE